MHVRICVIFEYKTRPFHSYSFLELHVSLCYFSLPAGSRVLQLNYKSMSSVLRDAWISERSKPVRGRAQKMRACTHCFPDTARLPTNAAFWLMAMTGPILLIWSKPAAMTKHKYGFQGFKCRFCPVNCLSERKDVFFFYLFRLCQLNTVKGSYFNCCKCITDQESSRRAT